MIPKFVSVSDNRLFLLSIATQITREPPFL